MLSAPETYAVVLKETAGIGAETGHAVGSVGLMLGKASNFGLPDTEAKIGYWIGVPFWGRGLIPEAVREMLRYGFEELKLSKIWCAYFDGNEKSKRAQEKCGFIYDHTNTDVYWELMDDIRTEHVSCLTRERWKEMQENCWCAAEFCL